MKPKIKYSGEPGRVFATVNGETFGPFQSIANARMVVMEILQEKAKVQS